MHRDEYLARLEALYAGYLKTVQELEDNRKLGEGMFGFKGGPADNPCHDRFAEDLRALLADFAAVQTGSVYCTKENFYQASMELGDLASDLHASLVGETDHLIYLDPLE